MKVYTRVVIDMNSLEVLEEESFEYNGPVVECKGGGGASGAVDFPTYMKEIHNDWLDNDGHDGIETSVTTMMNAALGSSPFTGASAYDPDTDITSMLGYVTDLDTLVGLLSSGTTLDTLVSNVLDDSRITDLAETFDSDLEDQIDTEVLPHFQAGMRDINSVMSSAFVIGEAIIEAQRVKESAKFLAQLRLKAGTDDALKLIGMKLQFQQSLTQLGVESVRIKIAAKSAETTQNIQMDESDAKWDLEVFQWGSNVLASISGAAHYVPNKEGKSAGDVIGGGLSGAAAGMMVGGPMGAVAGGVLGIGASLLS